MIPPEIRIRLLEPHGVRSSTALASGMSGASLFRCEGDRTWVLRRWPHSSSTVRIREIHSVISSAGRHCPLLPSYVAARQDAGGESAETWIRDNSGHIWDLSQWMPGQPLTADCDSSKIAEGASAIALVHAAMDLGGHDPRPAPAVKERLDRIDQLSSRLPACLDRNPTGRVHPLTLAPLTAAVRTLRSRWLQVASMLVDDLKRWQKPVPVQYVLRDVHREHILFHENRVSGVIDFDALRIDTPATDLARWAGSFDSFVDAPRQTVDLILAAYHPIRALQPRPGRVDLSCRNAREDAIRLSEAAPTGLARSGDDGSANDRFQIESAIFRTLVMSLAISSAWISLANWVIWLLDETRQFPDFDRVAERLSRLVDTTDRLPEC